FIHLQAFTRMTQALQYSDNPSWQLVSCLCPQIIPHQHQGQRKTADRAHKFTHPLWFSINDTRCKQMKQFNTLFLLKFPQLDSAIGRKSCNDMCKTCRQEICAICTTNTES